MYQIDKLIALWCTLLGSGLMLVSPGMANAYMLNYNLLIPVDCAEVSFQRTQYLADWEANDGLSTIVRTSEWTGLIIKDSDREIYREYARNDPSVISWPHSVISLSFSSDEGWGSINVIVETWDSQSLCEELKRGVSYTLETSPGRGVKMNLTGSDSADSEFGGSISSHDTREGLIHAVNQRQNDLELLNSIEFGLQDDIAYWAAEDYYGVNNAISKLKPLAPLNLQYGICSGRGRSFELIKDYIEGPEFNSNLLARLGFSQFPDEVNARCYQKVVIEISKFLSFLDGASLWSDVSNAGFGRGLADAGVKVEYFDRCDRCFCVILVAPSGDDLVICGGLDDFSIGYRN